MLHGLLQAWHSNSKATRQAQPSCKLVALSLPSSQCWVFKF